MIRKAVIVTLIAAAIVLASGLLTSSSPEIPNSDCTAIVEQFFAKMKSGDYVGAVDYIYANNQWIAAKSDEIQQLRTQFDGLAELVGEYIGHELILTESVSGRFVYLHYFVMMERQPLGFKFQFYKPADKWLTFYFAYEDDIDDWIEERGKQRFVNGE
jgi:hypothetical protein